MIPKKAFIGDKRDNILQQQFVKNKAMQNEKWYFYYNWTVFQYCD